jgi:drug/metabolite transporter (DMT)-like permease
MVGGVGFIIWMGLQKDLGKFKTVAKDRRGVTFATLTTLFGPVIGVSLSLAAVQYTDTGIASTLMALTPVLIIAPYAIIYKQKVKAKEILGVILSVIGVAMFFLL